MIKRITHLNKDELIRVYLRMDSEITPKTWLQGEYVGANKRDLTNWYYTARELEGAQDPPFCGLAILRACIPGPKFPSKFEPILEDFNDDKNTGIMEVRKLLRDAVNRVRMLTSKE